MRAVAMFCRYFLALFLVLGAVLAQDVQSPLFSESSDSDCHNACTALASTLGDEVYYNPASQLEGFSDLYYSNFQRNVIPACIITPTTGDHVSQVIKIVKDHQCIFAVKSGGHALFPGASNAPAGITIDLRKLNAIEPDEEGLTTRVGTGNRWIDVYKVLEPLNRTVVGGRNSQVGVGGFILGGGISFVSRRYGWALDNVRNFEVVLANGSLANVNQASAPDLYFALRGGGNNFGIVTRFDLETHPQGQVWGGQQFWLVDNAEIIARSSSLGLSMPQFSWTLKYFQHRIGSGVFKVACWIGYCTTMEKMLRVFEGVVMAEQDDPFAQLYLSFAYAQQLNAFITGGALVYSKPVPDPAVFSGFKALKAVYSTQRVADFTDIYEEVNRWNEIGYRQEWAAVTFKVSVKLLSKIVDIFLEEIQSIMDVKDVIPSIVMQPINKDEIHFFSKNGGNCLGIEDGDGPLILFSIAFRWTNPEDDLVMHTAGSNIINRAVALAKEMDLHHRYIYQNYANISQDVFGGYGEENRAKLKMIQHKYDPEGVFTKLQPGYFKL